MRPFTYIRAFNHKMREAWRYYRCVVEFYGPASDESRRVRANLRRQIHDH